MQRHSRRLSSVRKRSGLNADTLLAENVNHELSRPVVTVDLGVALEKLDVLHVLVKEVGRVHGTTLGLGVELGREDGAGLVHHTLVGAVVKVDEILLEVAREGADIDGVTVVLRGDVTLTSGQVKRRDVVGTVTILELDGLGTNSESKKLVTKANTHDGNRGSLHKLGEVVNSLLAVSGITRAVGNEDAIEVVGNLVDGVVVGEDGDGGATADQAAKDVLLDTAVDQSDVELGVGVGNHEGSLGGHALDKVDLARVDEALILIGVVLVANGDPGERGTLLTEVGDNRTSVNTGNGGNALAGAPLAQALNSSPVAVLRSDIGDNNTGALNVGGLEVLEEVELVTLIRRDTVVANQGLGEDQNLAAVRGIGHRLGVTNKGGGENGFTRNVGVGTEGGTLKNGAILNEKMLGLATRED